ncbi:MAG: IS1634 family transposase [bacterium]|nr:IS1634 family transposase [bacterium]
MQTRSGNLHLEIQTSRKNPVGILRTSSRDKASGKIVHTQHGRITGCSLPQLKLLQLAFRQKVVATDDPQAFRILGSKEYGASRALLELAKDLGLHRILYSRTEPWVDSALAMIIGRIIYQGSKLSLCNQSANTSLWELCGIAGRPDVEDHCYLPMDRLLERQEAIQKKLAAKHLSNGSLVLYDITSSYFEGEYEGSDLVHFGYNRDNKKGHEQIVIGLMCTAEGCPVGCEVFPGNTNDSTTVMGKITELRERYGLEKIVFVGDRGMVTKTRLSELRDIDGLNTISALTHAQMNDLIKRQVIAPDLFDEKRTVEITDPENTTERYCLCRNPVTRESERATRRRLIGLTEQGLGEIANYKRKATVGALGARVGKLLAKYKMGKFFEWEIHTDSESDKSGKSKIHRLEWSLKEERIACEESLDGCYIVNTDVSENRMDRDEIVASYRALGNVERAFRSLKQMHLEMRPVYHKIDRRIRAHVFLCTLAYYVQWHMTERLQPLFDADGKGKDRRWTVQNVIERLKQVTRNEVSSNGVTFHQITERDEDQEQILSLLGVAL